MYLQKAVRGVYHQVSQKIEDFQLQQQLCSKSDLPFFTYIKRDWLWWCNYSLTL